MSQQKFNLIDIIRKDFFDPSGTKIFNISQWLFLQLTLKRNTKILQSVIRAVVGKRQALSIENCEQDLTTGYNSDPHKNKRRTDRLSTCQWGNDLIQKEIRKHTENDSKRHANDGPYRVLPVFSNIRSYFFEHRLFLSK